MMQASNFSDKTGMLDYALWCSLYIHMTNSQAILYAVVAIKSIFHAAINIVKSTIKFSNC